MANRVAQHRIEGVRATQSGHLLRLRVRLEEGDAQGDLAPGWYAVALPIQAIRLRDATDEPLNDDDIIADESLPFEDRLDALRRTSPPA